MSHQDVVEIGDRSQWSHDPFSGLLLDDSVYGRGTTDCKHLVLSELEALESLLPKASGLITTSTCLWATVRKCILKMMWTEPSASWTI